MITSAKAVQEGILNTADHGVPQRRKRIFLLGVRVDSLSSDTNMNDWLPEPLLQAGA